MNLDLIFPDLIAGGMIRIDHTTAHDIDKKIKQFEYLIGKSKTTNVEQKYLNLYDGLFRLFEISLARLNHAITNTSPHKTFKILYEYLYPGLDKEIRLNDLVKLRHLVKKNGLAPSNEDVKKLEKCVEHARSFIKI